MIPIVSNLVRLSQQQNCNLDALVSMQRVTIKKGTIVFSLDVETNGPNHDLLSGGIVAFDNEGNEIGFHRFSIVPQGEGKPETVKWLKSQFITDGDKKTSAYNNSLVGAVEASQAMQEATDWCMKTLVENGGRVGLLVCFPSAFDGRFWTNYCERYNKNGYESFLRYFPKARVDPDRDNYRDPFGFNHLDGQTFAMAQLKLEERWTLKQLRAACFTPSEIECFEKVAHDAVHDARNQGVLFFRLANLQLVELTRASSSM